MATAARQNYVSADESKHTKEKRRRPDKIDSPVSGYLSEDLEESVSDVKRRFVSSSHVNGQIEKPRLNESENENGSSSSELEPWLKFEQLQGDAGRICISEGVSCFTAMDKLIALGSTHGSIHIFDIQGNQVKEYTDAHSSRVTAMAFNSSAEWVISVSEDRDCTAVIHNLFSSQVDRIQTSKGQKIACVAMDPLYGTAESSNDDCRLVIGCKSGELLCLTKTWLGWRTEVIHQGKEGSVLSVSWQDRCLAWANEKGVKVLDMGTQQRLAFIDRPPSSDHSQPWLLWQGNDKLVIGWHNCVKIAQVTMAKGKGQAGAVKSMGILSIFTVDSPIRGISTLGKESLLALLEGSTDSSLEIVELNDSGTVLRRERVPGQGSREFNSLAHYPDPEDGIHYLVSNSSILETRVRGDEDHLTWLLDRGALGAAAMDRVKEMVDAIPSAARVKIADRFLHSLPESGRWSEASSLSGSLLGAHVSAWERWVVGFAASRQVPLLLPYIPTSSPRLGPTTYQMALESLLLRQVDHALLLDTIRSWPSDVYSISDLMQAVKLRLSRGGSNSLKMVLAELYMMSGSPEEALTLYLETGGESTLGVNHPLFDFLDQQWHQQKLQELHGKVVKLLHLNEDRVTDLLVAHRQIVPPSIVVPQLEAHVQQLSQVDGRSARLALHRYLHAIFLVDVNAGSDFHDRQVELYAEFDSSLLLNFLQTSQNYALKDAFQVCGSHGLLSEQVFILSRMGDSQQALHLIVHQIRDIRLAVDFVKRQQDDALWRDLVEEVVTEPDMVELLLELAIDSLDPHYLIQQLRPGVHVQGLRNILLSVIANFRTETSLRQGCNDVLRADCVHLLARYFSEARRAARVGRQLELLSLSKETTVGASSSSGRCAACLGSVAMNEEAAIVFFCSHSFHRGCLEGSLGGSHGSHGIHKRREEESSPDDLHCILCSAVDTRRQRAG